MHIIKLPIGLLAISLMLSNLSSVRVGGLSKLQSGSQEESSKTVVHMAEVLDRIAASLNYRSVRAYKVEPDDWDTDERQALLVTHAYYSLFSREPDSLLDLGPMHRGVSRKHIRVIILLFKDAERAGKETVLLRRKMEGDIGARVIKADQNGYEIRAAIRSQIAVRRGAKVIVLETDKQGEAIRTMGAKLEQANW